MESRVWKQKREPFVWLWKNRTCCFNPQINSASCYARHLNSSSLGGLPGSGGERFFIAAVRLSSLVCNIFMASLASESWIMLQIRLQAIIWSYGLAQAGEEDLSPFTVNKRKTAVIQTWNSPLILTSCRSFMRVRGLCDLLSVMSS